MDSKGFVMGLFAGAIIAIVAVIAHDKSLDATPAYNEGWADGFNDGREVEEQAQWSLDSFRDN